MLAAMRREYKIAIVGTAVFVALYVVLAYFLLPSTWRHYEHQKKLATLAMVTHTKAGIPGDPINVGLVGSKEDVLCAMKAAGGIRPIRSRFAPASPSPAASCWIDLIATRR